MFRTVMMMGAALALLAAGCVAQQGQMVEKLKADLAASNEKVAEAEARSVQLASDLATAQAKVREATDATGKSAAELDELRKKFEGVDVSLVEQLKDVPGVTLDKKGAIQLSGVSFEFAGGELKAESAKAIEKVGGVLAARKGLVYVDGHTDNIPVKAPKSVELYVDNLGLSLARAAAVARALVDAKVPAERLVVRGFGSTQPIAPNDTDEGRAKNRRVEIRLVPSEPTK